MTYGAWVNQGGLGCEKPLKLKYQKDTKDYWVNEGEWTDDFSFDKKGLDVKDGVVRFVSDDKKLVEAFILGIRAAGTIFESLGLGFNGLRTGGV